MDLKDPYITNSIDEFSNLDPVLLEYWKNFIGEKEDVIKFYEVLTDFFQHRRK